MKNRKKEARTIVLDYLKEGDLVIAIIFRGCWIDAITMKRGLRSFEEITSWLKEEGYLCEISYISNSIKEHFGPLNLPITYCCIRNLNMAKILIEGVRDWLNSFIKDVL
ncbi:MAG: hypothetical protein NZ922_00470 [Candidatus Methanomethyliaceae archaeon]|nr:hypothetical protein [Candidatus Methanomethyliaceae archaeon]MDW7970452.1 hypothetical protein [Nitrososphaerota archaeon]